MKQARTQFRTVTRRCPGCHKNTSVAREFAGAIAGVQRPLHGIFEHCKVCGWVTITIQGKKPRGK